jgi:asparagine synthase (glutamine-hydrolysing)
MCGIVGLRYFDDGRAVRPEQLAAMNGEIAHRGPDDAGHALFGPCGIAMRRLSIIDVRTGRQPVSNEDGTVSVVFNGEIYNHADLRDELKAAGHRFATVCDTETLVHGYEEWGLDFVGRLDGMFGFALWDARRRRLVLGRDRIGIKPLYYYLDKNVLAFASEVKALLRLEDVPRRVNLEALDEFMTLEYVLAPRTLLRGVQKLRPSHLLVAEGGKVVQKRYWAQRVEALRREGTLPAVWTEKAACERLRETLGAAVKSHLMSEVPLGAFLSGGVDSSVIVGLMARELSRPVKTFSVGFEDATYDELGYARLVSRAFGTDHHEFVLRPDPQAFLDDFVRFLDEPIGDVSVFPTFLVSQKTREHVTVALSGDGGDELFGGYDTYLADRLDRWYRRTLPAPAREWLRLLFERLPPTPKKKGLINRLKRFTEGAGLPPELRQYRWMSFLSEQERRSLYTPFLQDGLSDGNAYRRLLEVFNESLYLEPELNRQIYADLNVYLPEDILAKVDITSMANSLEVRVPFLDHHVVELALSMPDGLKIRGTRRKYVLKKAFEGLLPREVLERGKEGFSIPLKNWLRRELSVALREVLSEAEVRRLGFFDWPAVETMLREHASGAKNHSHRLWCLMVFHLWHRKYIEQPAPAASAAVRGGPGLSDGAAAA